jgi:ferredoxin
MAARTSLDHDTLHISVDPGVCIGAANCVLWAAGTFTLDAGGLVCLSDGPDAGSDGYEAILEAARNCPSGAIAVTSPAGSYPA